MALVTRVNGDAQPVLNVGTQTASANNVIISTGVAGPVNVYNVEIGGNLANELGAGGAVETLLRAIAANASILAYQTSAGTGVAGELGGHLTVLVERSGWASNVTLQTFVRALGSNIGATQAVDASAAYVRETTLLVRRP